MQMVFINECKSREVSHQMFFNVMFSFFFKKKEADWLWYEYCKVKLFSGTISHGATKEGRLNRVIYVLACCINMVSLRPWCVP